MKWRIVFLLFILGFLSSCDSTPKDGMTKIGKLTFQNQAFTKQDDAYFKKKKEGGRVWTWQKADGYCSSLSLGEAKDWRLPSVEELKFLLTKNAGETSNLDENIIDDFIDSMTKHSKYGYRIFWASKEKDEKSAWAVNFNDGGPVMYYKYALNNVLCVSDTAKK